MKSKYSRTPLIYNLTMHETGSVLFRSLIPATRQKNVARSLCFCLICCNWYLANLWFTFGATCSSNRSQIFAGFVLSSVFSQVQPLYVSNPCLLIYNKMSEACSFSEYSPLKISAVFLEFRQFVSQI